MKLILKIGDQETELLPGDEEQIVHSLNDNPFYSDVFDRLAKSQSYLVREIVAYKRNISEETWKDLIADPAYSVVENAISNRQFKNKINISTFFNIYNQHNGLFYKLIHGNLQEILANDENTEEDIEKFHNFILESKNEEVKNKYIEIGLSSEKFLRKFLKG